MSQDPDRRAVCLIVNPTAGGGRAGRAAPTAVRALESHGLRVRSVVAATRADVAAVAAQAARAGEVVVTLGGDGIAGAAAGGLREVAGSLLGIVPAGRGNDLARVLGLPHDTVQACAVIAHGSAWPMDLGEVNGQVFVGIAGVGWDSEANRIANDAPSWLGAGVYTYGGLRSLVGWRCVEFEVELVGSAGPGIAPGSAIRRRFSGYTVGLANSRCYGGGMRLAPDALLDDGLLDVVMIERMARLRAAWHLPKLFRGAHLALPTVHVVRASEVLISAAQPVTMYADGDPIAELPVRARVLPGAIRVLADPGEHGPFKAAGGERAQAGGRFGEPADGRTDGPVPAAVPVVPERSEPPS